MAPMAGAASAMEGSSHPSLFLSCAGECFEDYLKQELSYFDFTSDPRLSTYNIVVSRQSGADGGIKYTVNAVHASSRRLPPEATSVPAGSPEDVARRLLSQAILRTLLRDLEGTEHEGAFELALPRRSTSVLGSLRDPWDYWVFSPEVGGSGEGGSGYYFATLRAALTVRRITDRTKLRLRTSFEQSLSGYVLETGEQVSGAVTDWQSRGLLAYSLGRSFALGGVLTGWGSEFENYAGHVHGGPLGEWNLFPYAESASRQLRFAYQAGLWKDWYLEPNLAGRRRELRAYHALSLIADVNQAWGSIDWVLQVNQFLGQPEQYRISTGGSLTLRLVQGFALTIAGEAAVVRDLINLRGREITDLELLLWTAQQPTGYLIEGSVSLSYTFGSRHSTIVNPRFGRVDLDEE